MISRLFIGGLQPQHQIVHPERVDVVGVLHKPHHGFEPEVFVVAAVQLKIAQRIEQRTVVADPDDALPILDDEPQMDPVRARIGGEPCVRQNDSARLAAATASFIDRIVHSRQSFSLTPKRLGSIA